MTDTTTVTYLGESTLTGSDLVLQTASGLGPDGLVSHPRFFDGFLTEPELGARALLAVANVAATSYYQRINWASLDPVVTSDGEGLRFESFSGCCGVYARYDVLPNGLSTPPSQRGTTNVDVNLPLRRALALVTGREPMHLSVGPNDLTVTTLDSKVVEHKVTLPQRWVRGFAEAPAATHGMELRFEVPAVTARRFLQSLPKSGRGGDSTWVVASGPMLRAVARPTPEAVCLAGPHRLREMEPLLRFATSLRAYGPAYSGRPVASTWELLLNGGRLTLTLSPQVDRGFSGEGGVLDALASGDGKDDAARVIDALAWLPGSQLDTLAFALGIDEPAALRALATLGTSGRVGYDLAERAWFHRELPFEPDRVEQANPRLVAARELLAAGAVDDRGEIVIVRSGDHAQQVRRTAEGLSCTCQWWTAYAGTRGPCKHVLAVTLAQQSPADASSPAARPQRGV